MNSLLLIAALIVAWFAAVFLVRWLFQELTPSPGLRLCQTLLARKSAPACSPLTAGALARAGQGARPELAVELLEGGCPCSEVILRAFGPSLDLTRGEAFEMALRLGQQMNMCDTCGAVTGALIVLGERYLKAGAGQSKNAPEIAERVGEFTSRFAAHHGTLNCRKLSGTTSVSARPGRKCDAASRQVPSECRSLVRDAGEILEEMLR